LEARGISVDPSKLTNEQLDVLLRQKSFAGQLQHSIGDTTSGDALAKDVPLANLAKAAKEDASSISLCTCFWRRDIDYQPPSGGLDIGVCASSPPNSDESIDLRETGDDASYAEGWHRLPGSAVGPYFALRLLSENNVERTGYWVRTGKYFAYAIGRPDDLDTSKSLECHEKSASIKECIGKSLSEAVKSISDDIATQMEIVGSYLGLYGEVSESGTWTISHSTDPGLVGCFLVGSDIDTDACCSVLSALDGSDNSKLDVGSLLNQAIAGENGIVRKWKVVEFEGSSNLPGFE
jgi:hypothetical protein